MKIGLTLGKYSPFHKGHQHLIETAISEMDHVIAIIYNSPETTTIPLQIRAGWIRKLYPNVEVIEAWDGPTIIGNTPDIKKLHEDYILNKLGEVNISAFYSSEFYGDHVSQALSAINKIVDRKTIDISGTQIRKDFFKHRSFLHPFVYKDFITNVVFLGAPSTGKTTIAKILGERYETKWMPEYGRSYWKKNNINRRLSKEQLLEIATDHLKKEDQLVYESKEYLFTDTNATTTFMFGRYYHSKVLKELQELAQSTEKRYDLWFLCSDDIPYEDTWDRSGELNRTLFQFEIEADLKARKTPYIRLSGNLDQRIDKVSAVLSKFNKFESIIANNI